jgi:putative RNA 2'-phosphotransferase
MAKHKKEKFLTLILRHQPEVVGITLDQQGWANVSALVKGIQQKYPDFDDAALRYIVDNSEKKRFEYRNDTRTAIRACQGHSVKIDLGLPTIVPPDTLWHGTVSRNWTAIKYDGIKSMSRTHVQLSEDKGTAENVGARHGDDVVLILVDAKGMHDAGHEFTKSTNGVWLVKHVPPLFVMWGQSPDSPYSDC